MTETPAWMLPAEGLRTLPVPDWESPGYVTWDQRVATDMSRFLADARNAFGEWPFTSRDTIDAGIVPPLQSRDTADPAKSIGRHLLAREGRWLDGHRVTCTGRSSRTGVRLWRIEVSPGE